MTSKRLSLSLCLAGPLQSWGTSSRFTQRNTGAEPSKSGVIGLLAGALGRRRSESLEDLFSLSFGVRSDQPGTLLTDLQTSHQPPKKAGGSSEALPLTHRQYLADAAYLAVVNGPEQLMMGLRDALFAPRFALALGRRSCPPARPILHGVHDEGLVDVLATAEWLGTSRGRRPAELAVVRDVLPNDEVASTGSEPDAPRSFDSNHRQYAWRDVVRYYVPTPSDQSSSGPPDDDIDWFEAVRGA